MSGTNKERWPTRVLRFCLHSWPRVQRGRDGKDLLAAFDEGLDDTVRHPVGHTLAECLTVLATGAGLRSDALGASVRSLATGWGGDLRHATRTLRRSPGFTGTVVLTLAIGIGANGVVLTLVDRALFSPPPFEEPDALVFAWNTIGESSARVRVPAPDVAEFRSRTSSFEAFAFLGRGADGALGTDDDASAQHVRVAAVSPNLFALLGTPPLLGPGLATRGGAADGSDTAEALLSYGIWRSVFAKDEGILGRTIRLDGGSVVVVGVMPPDFRIPLPPQAGMGTEADIWTPLGAPLSTFERSDGRRVDQDSDNTGAAIGRMRAGVELEQAATELDRAAAELRREIPGYAESEVGVTVRPLYADSTEHVRGLLSALLAGAVMVLLVTCLNVSALLLARSAGRSQELSIRTALGAGTAAIVRQLLLEAGMLVVVGTLAALAVALLLHPVVTGLMPNAMGVPRDLSLDGRPFALAAVIAAGATILFGVAPALRATRAERSGGIGTAFLRGRADPTRIRSALLVTQVAFSLVLVLGSTLLLRTVQELYTVAPGFRSESAMTFSLSVRSGTRYRGPADRAALMSSIDARLRDIPGVRSVGLTAHMPLSGRSWTQPYGLPGQSEDEWAQSRADFRTVSSGFFEAMGTRILEGRPFTSDEDLNEDRRVAIIDQTLANRVAPVGSAVGAEIGFPLDGLVVHAEVVGVVEHVRHETLASDGREAIYVPYRQEASRDVSFAVRTDGDPSLLTPEIRRAVASVDDQLPVYGLRTLADYVDGAVAPSRFAFAVLGIFAVLVLLSVAIGLYGLLALEVTRRTREIGVRLALGAERAGIVRSILWIGWRLVSLGIAIGVVFAAVFSRGLSSIAAGTAVGDPLVWLAVLAAVSGVAMVACWAPARRASRLDPNVALRIE